MDGKHVVFGRVVEGQEVLDMIEAVPTDSEGKPKQSVIIAESGVLE